MKIENGGGPTWPLAGLFRTSSSMRITTQRVVDGTAYRIFRCGENFRSDIKQLAPWLLRARKRVLIEEATCRPALVLTIEPLDTVLEEEFISTVGRFLVQG